MSLPPLRDYQQNAIDRAREAIAAGAQAPLIVQPTGCGKTRTAVEACAGHVAQGGAPMFVAPRRELIAQATATFRARGLHPGDDVFVRTIQELSMPGAKIPPATMVVLDEARHYVADAWSRLRKALPHALYLGLDATPERGDGRGLGGMFDTLIEAISIGEAIDGGYLVPCDTLRPPRALGPDELAQDPVDEWFAHSEGQSTVLFAPTVELAQRYAERFYDRGIPAACVWGDMPVDDRDHALELYERGEILVLTNVQLLTEGWDSPRTSCVMLAGGVGTVGGLLQRAGRGLRPFAGKTKCVINDLRGVTHTFGEIDDARTWHLDGRAARRAAGVDDKTRFCPVCGSVVVASPCPECGYTGELRKRRPRVLGLPMDRFAREHAMPDEKAAKELRGLLRVAQAKGRHRGWAVHVFEAKFGRKVTPELLKLAATS